MKRITSAAAAIAAALALGACGGQSATTTADAPPCYTMSNGNRLCGEDAADWCSMEGRSHDVGTDEACVEAQQWVNDHTDAPKGWSTPDPCEEFLDAHDADGNGLDDDTSAVLVGC